MRIDYHEPKLSYTSSPGKQQRQQRTEQAGIGILAVVVIALLSGGGGFGAGWFFSQKAAKKSFQAAMEQKSLENSPRPEPPAKTAPAASPNPTLPAAAAQPATTASFPASPPQAAPETQLSFYKTLPSGQKSAVLGSGINAKEDKAKQPLQAALPSNLTKPPPPQAPTEPAKPAEKSARQEPSGFTVQLASFSLKSEAETLRSKLAGKGYHAYINESNQGDKGMWYRVRVGKKLDADAAKELAAKLGKGALAIPDRD